MSRSSEPAGATRRTSTALRLVGLYSVVAALHLAGIWLFVRHGGTLALGGAVGSSAVYAGAGLTAYLLGVRHAFDADHIAAIDDTTLLLLRRGRRPLGVGLAFSLGHSAVVLGLSIGVAFAAQAAARFQEGFAATGELIGTVVSTTFLYLLAVLNGVVLVGLARTWRSARRGRHDDVEVAALLARRGLLNRVFRGRYERVITREWHMIGVGFLFGLGFDTATQVGALGLAAGSAAKGGLPAAAVLALPLLFAAGMTLFDTTDGVLIARAYGWAARRPLRRIFYNMTLTGLSVLLAGAIATLQVARLVSERTDWSDRRPWTWFHAVDLNAVGMVAVVVLLGVWVLAVLLSRMRRRDSRSDVDRNILGPDAGEGRLSRIAGGAAS